MVDAFESPNRHPYRSVGFALAPPEASKDGESFAVAVKVVLAALSFLRAGLDLVSADMTAGGLAALALFVALALALLPAA